MSTNTPHLERCPLCPDGGKPYFTKSVNGSSMAYVGCSQCGVQLKAQVQFLTSREDWTLSKDIIGIWNRRAAVAGPRGETFTAEVIGDSLQKRLFDECVTANWDPERKNTFAEEIAHLHEELSEAFRAFRRYKDFAVREVNGKLEGVPIEFADALIGMFYNAELYGFDLLDAIERKHQFNLGRNYVAEGRQLHTPAATASPTPAESVSRVADMAEPKSEAERICVHCLRQVESSEYGPPINDIVWSHIHSGVVWCHWPTTPEKAREIYVAPAERTRVEGEQWRQGMRDAAKEVCDACADEYRYGRARKIDGSTRWWHGEHADFQCEAGSIWHALEASAAAPTDNDTESPVQPEQIVVIDGERRRVVSCPDGRKDCEVLHTEPATTTKGDR